MACDLGRTSPACHARHFRPAPPPRRRRQLRAPNTSTTASARPVSCCPESALEFGGTRRPRTEDSAKFAHPNPNSIGKYGLSPRSAFPLASTSPRACLSFSTASFCTFRYSPERPGLSDVTLATPPVAPIPARRDWAMVSAARASTTSSSSVAGLGECGKTPQRLPHRKSKSNPQGSCAETAC